MYERLKNIFFFFPVQLVLLHFRKYQILLVFWLILFTTVSGDFMHVFGAESLFLAPEYKGAINYMGAALVGVSVGMFIMSWNISTFILFSRHFRFLSATTNPFLKYCINNAAIPVIFIVYYFIKAYHFLAWRELLPGHQIALLATGFLCGLILLLLISFIYFFRADYSILKKLQPVITASDQLVTEIGNKERHTSSLIHVRWYLNSLGGIRRARDVRHYTPQFVELLFKRHHFAAITTVFFAFVALVVSGFFLDNPAFQLPAAASITIAFAIAIGVAGAITYFLQSWGVLFVLGIMVAVNFAIQHQWIDTRNKAYGLVYTHNDKRPRYDSSFLNTLCTPEKMATDIRLMEGVLQNWKQKIGQEKPLLVLLNTSGGGHRSAVFTMGVLQQLDSITQQQFPRQLFLINGASGGMIGATFFRELYRQRLKYPDFNINDKKFVDDICKDLLNPIFSSFVARDLLAPAQKFTYNNQPYIKDRAYAFEQQLNANTGGMLDRPIHSYKADEMAARIPLQFFNSVVTRDSRKMIISSLPVSFMMKNPSTKGLPQESPDAIDFGAFFKEQDPYSLRLLSALRMNATFPLILPNVLLPTVPEIDVMDAGLRDNYGQESTLRFIQALQEWIKENTAGVLLVQIRDRVPGGWEMPYESKTLTENLGKPIMAMQQNLFKIMEFYQNNELTYLSRSMDFPIHKVIFQYKTLPDEEKAPLNFHLTTSEKLHILSSLQQPVNREAFDKVQTLLTR